MNWQIALPFEPRRKRAHRVARTPHGAPVVSDPDKAIKTDLATFIAENCPLPTAPFAEAVELTITFLMSLPASLSGKEKARRLEAGAAFQDSRDCDNMVKLYQDVLQTGPLAGKIWKDDHQVSRLAIEKLWTSGDPMVLICVRKWSKMLAL